MARSGHTLPEALARVDDLRTEVITPDDRGRGRCQRRPRLGNMWAMPRVVLVLALVASAVAATTARSPHAHAGPAFGNERWALIIGLDHFQGSTRPNSGSVGDAED